MRVQQLSWSTGGGWTTGDRAPLLAAAQLVLFFGSRVSLTCSAVIDELQRRYPNAHLAGCSTAGEISGTSEVDQGIVATAIEFASVRIASAYEAVTSNEASGDAGERAAHDLPGDGLRHLFVLAGGLEVNGSDLVDGLRRAVPADVGITGGLSGDGEAFEKTIVYSNGAFHENGVAVVGFYGAALRLSYGSMGGWDSFGPDRLITRSTRNVLYELDGESALDLYKTYLGAHAAKLPARGLLFPLSLRLPQGDQRVMRTILGVDEEEGSLIFAGNMPEGSYAQLMRANITDWWMARMARQRNACGGCPACPPRWPCSSAAWDASRC